MYFDKIFYDDKNNVNEVQLICNECGNYLQIKYDKSIFTTAKNEYCVVEDCDKIVCKCGNKCNSGLIEPKKQNKIIYKNIQTEQTNIPHCPTCNSTNISKIGTGERVGSVVMLGLFSKKINKSFKCKNCGYTW